ncbi:hypothetical protein [Microbacterium murale]|uniref:Uncharacterized protein n=1 Tax=Microbacterium murale TaxID=1081040 RepID=A0ABU0PDY4_9MICO|nr:hypothetical protein [Microbacterium murale]MDQ0645539.1 hypothetical protein [Microbacterium murale]
MALIPQQKVISVTALGGGEAQAIQSLEEALRDWPPVRIVSIAVRGVANPLGRGEMGTSITAVVETV